jgi:hypothetical protein
MGREHEVYCSTLKYLSARTVEASSFQLSTKL